MTFYIKIEISHKNTYFLSELTTDPNVTYDLLEKYIICQGETTETSEDQIESL